MPDHAAQEIIPITAVFQYFLPDSSVFSILQFLGNFWHSILEFDLFIDWLSIIVVFESQAHAATQSMRVLNFFASNSGSPCCTQALSSLFWFFSNNSLLSSSLKIFSKISSIRIEFSESLKRMTPNSVPSTFPWHQLYNTDHKTVSFLSLSVKQSVSRCMLSLLAVWRAKSSWETCETEDSNIVRTPNSPVFSCVFFEKSEIPLRSGSSMSIVSVSTEVILSNSLGS